MTVGYDSGSSPQRSKGIWVMLLVLVVAIGGGAFWYTRGHRTPSATEDALAASAPADTQLYLSVDARAQTTTAALIAHLDTLRQKFPEVAKAVDKAETDAGVKLTELAKFAEPAGFLAVLPAEGQKGLVPTDPKVERPLEVLVGFPVTDEAAARQTVEALAKKANSAGKTETIDGVEMRVGPNGAAVAVTGRFIWIGTDAKTIARGVKAATGKAPSLAQQDLFNEARKRVGAHGGLFYYMAVRDALAGLTSLPQLMGQVDEETAQAIQAVPYMAGALDFTEHAESQFFIKVDAASKSDFAKALLTPRPLSSSIARFFPASWGNYASVNAMYAGSLVYELIRLSPRGRGQLGQLPMLAMMFLGFDPIAAFQRASNGDIAYSSDVFRPEVLKANFMQSRARGMVTACGSNLRNIGTALEMYSVDHSGRFPKTLAELTPNYLKTIPTCPAAGADTYSSTFTSGASPDTYEFGCGGHHHEQAGAAENRPRYTSTVGLDGMPPPPRAAPVTVVVAISVKDAAAATELIEKLEKKGKMSSRVMKTVEGAEVRGYDGVPTRWAMVSQPVSALLVATGPEADARLEEALKSASQPAASVDGVADYQAMTKASQGKAVQSGYVDFTPLVAGGEQLLESIPTSEMSAEARAWLMEQLKSHKAAFMTTSVATVEADGVNLQTRGLASPVAGIGIISAIMLPNFIRARSQGQTTACKSNLKNIGTALEMYSTDNGGRFPTNLGALTPNYLKRIPSCPAAGTDTYSSGFASAVGPDGYTVVCTGSNHGAAGYSPNYPQYTSLQGLVER